MWLDSNLSMGDHITKTSSAAFYYLYNIRRIRKYLSKECTETLIHDFISGLLDCCNSLLYGLLAYQVQKFAKSPELCCTSCVRRKQILSYYTNDKSPTHWLPAEYCIVFKNLLLTFKAIHKLVPTYISLHFRTCIFGRQWG